MDSISQITTDEDLITLELRSGLHQVLPPPHAQGLLEMLIEFSSKTGSTDLELSPYRSLTVQGTEGDVLFCLFRAGRLPNDWVILREVEVTRFVAELQSALSGCKQV